ncbi:Uncharacterised protein r2_g1727 [Pycnogonum litorale]
MERAVKCKLFLYADDSALIIVDRHVETLQKCLNQELNSLNSWLIDNRLSLHIGKTEAILIGSKHNLKQASSLNLIHNNTKIASVTYLERNLINLFLVKKWLKKF